MQMGPPMKMPDDKKYTYLKFSTKVFFLVLVTSGLFLLQASRSFQPCAALIHSLYACLDIFVHDYIISSLSTFFSSAQYFAF